MEFTRECNRLVELDYISAAFLEFNGIYEVVQQTSCSTDWYLLMFYNESSLIVDSS
jgi:hypothetical protein